MKLAELGLKTKPETKYFAGGYISFQTKEGELFWELYTVGKTHQGKLFQGKVDSKDKLSFLMSFKFSPESLESLQ